jgi:hypothetical protein
MVINQNLEKEENASKAGFGRLAFYNILINM